MDLQERAQVGHLAEAQKGHQTSHRMVGVMLQQLGYSLQSNRKPKEGANHPDRNAQFEHINRKVRDYLKRGDPVISVDTKKKELVGDFKNNGQERQPKGQPGKVQGHDFADPEKGHVRPCGVYDMARNEGWVSVGVDHDTAAVAVETIRRLWRQMGQKTYGAAKQLPVTADAGGSNGERVRI